MENTQYSFDSGEHRLCNFFGKKGRARRQTRRARRKGGAEQAQENVDATEYVDQEEDTKVTVETLTEKRNKIQENRNVAVDKFESIKKKMETKGYNEAAEELNKFYQEEYLKQVAEHEGELDEAYAKHEEAQENPIYQKQITKQCGRCYYYRWILVRRQKEMDEHERTLDGLLDRYDEVTDKLTRNLSREADRVENDYYRVEEVEVKKTDPDTGEETVEVKEINIQERVEETIVDIEEIVEKEEAEEQAEAQGEVIEVIEEDVKTVEEVAEELVEDGQEIGETIIENVEEEIKHNFLDQLKEPEAQTLMEAGVEAGKDDVKIMEELSKKYEVNLNDDEKVAVKKEIAKFRKAREIREKVEKDYGPKMERFKEGVGEWIGKWEIARGRASGAARERCTAMVKLLREVHNAVPQKGTGPDGKITLKDLVDYKQMLVDKRSQLRNEDFARGKDFDEKWGGERREIVRLTETMHTQVRYLNIYIAQLTVDLKEADYNQIAEKRRQEGRS
ncbi:MAG: hypothetical protein QF809_04685 [Candidatus Peribacteraceae bacterium]|nr:hypothetical protein [Candidatus Peribacteraceae bacterium]